MLNFPFSFNFEVQTREVINDYLQKKMKFL